MNTNYEFDLELDELSPSLKQPNDILISLKPHQLACLYKAKIMESYGSINYNINSKNNNDIYNTGLNGEYKISTNIGIIGDIVGYGKTLTALSIISANKVDDIYINKSYQKSYISNLNYSYFSYNTKNDIVMNEDQLICSTLIIVPRGPVYLQWLKTLKRDTNLNFLAIDNLNYIRKNLPNYDDVKNDSNILKKFLSKYDVVLIKNTTYDVLINYYNNIHLINENNFNSSNAYSKHLFRWKRVMIDEAHDLIKNIPVIHYYYLWLISGTYDELIYSIRSPSSILWDIRHVFNDAKNIKLMLIKCKKEFVRNSFKLDIPEEKYYLCKMPILFHTIKDFVTNNIIEKLNANDINGAIKDLGGKTDTQDNIINIISKDITIELENKNKELEYVKSLIILPEIKENKISKLENEITVLNDKLNNLKNRISELSKKTCPICMEYITNPILLKCSHTYCAICIINWIKNNQKCPECRDNINTEELIAITDKKCDFEENIILNKVDTLINIINNKQNGKFLVFSKFESGFLNIIQKLKDNNITFAELKGNTSHMMNVLNSFKNSNIKVILLNTYHAGSGIDISFATDVVIFHSMGLYKNQAVGRAQRVGRIDKLYIHNLCYEQEMPN
tara:strand:- start:75 stop:1934 length:1860 start_codon:yes stop_codon:yes gene_type:complete